MLASSFGFVFVGVRLRHICYGVRRPLHEWMMTRLLARTFGGFEAADADDEGAAAAAEEGQTHLVGQGEEVERGWTRIRIISNNTISTTTTTTTHDLTWE